MNEKDWNKKYILDENGEVKEVELPEWAEWLENNREKRIIKQDTLDGRYSVSTIFIGLPQFPTSDSPDADSGSPLLFETMVFYHGEGTSDWNEYTVRYSTKEAALAGHEDIVKRIENE